MMELTALEARRVLDRTEPVALGALLREVASSAQTAATSRNVRIRIDGLREDIGEAHVDGDRFLLRQAIGNLLDNAIDFAPAGSQVVLALRLAARQNAVITVRDRGPGIPDYAQGKVFEKFYSLARPHSQKKSTGLGLAFVQEIAALHRGRIELGNAKDGDGAVATLTLPLAHGAKDSRRMAL